MKFTFIALILGIFGLTSCQKENSIPTATASNYMSLTANSSWTYETTDNVLNDSSTYTLLSTNSDSTINGKVYHVFTNSGSGNQYYNITGSDYYSFQNLPVAVSSANIESIYLKDNLAVNGSWQQSFTTTTSGLPLTVNSQNTITEKNISIIVNGITYTDVIHVSTSLSAFVSGFPLPAGAIISDIQTYYAKKVGMIKSKYKISINYGGNANDIDQTTYLKSSIIK